jgi:predicted nucleic acid-binding protein
MRIYVDGTALSRFLIDEADHEAWVDWVAEREDALLTTQLALTEMRQVADPRGLAARQCARDVADRIETVRFSDRVLATAAMAASVLTPFEALHLGVAVAHPEVGSLATYDARLAQVATIYGVDVVTPGRNHGWWERLA